MSRAMQEAYKEDRAIVPSVMLDFLRPKTVEMTVDERVRETVRRAFEAVDKARLNSN
jgi:hypothetical protein